MKRLSALLLAALMTFTVAACTSDGGTTTTAGDSSTTTAAAGDTTTGDTAAGDTTTGEDFSGKKLNVVTTSESYLPLFEKFEEETGAEVEFLSMSSGEVISRIKAEGGTPMADLWFGGGIDAFMAAKEDGLLEPYNPPEASDVAPEYKDAEGYWGSKGLTVVAFMVDPEILASKGLEVPTSWADLADPAYKDEIIMSNPAISGTNYAVVKGLIDLMGEEEAWEFFAKMNENIPFYGRRGGDPQEKVTAGEFAIGIVPAAKQQFDAAEEHGLQMVWPEEGIPWVPEGVAIFKGGQGVDVAKAFVSFMLRIENQEMLAEIDGKDGAQMIKPGVDGYDNGLPEELLIEQDLSTFGSERENILDRWQELTKDKPEPEE